MSVATSSKRSLLAYVLSAVTSPFLILPLLVLGATWGIAPTLGEFVLWGSIILWFIAILPTMYVVWAVRTKRITDVHITMREQRASVFLVFLVSAAVALGVLWWLGAPKSIFLLALVAMGNGIFAACVTFFWKVSMHAWVYAVATASLALIAQEPRAWWLLLGLPAIVWARTVRQRHTPMQGIIGALLGLGTTYLLYLIAFTER